MDELSKFVMDLMEYTPKGAHDLTVKQAQFVVRQINEFLYTNYDGIGTTEILNENFQYFSDFHKYWSNHYKEILDIQVDENQCSKVADVLHNIWVKSNGSVFLEMYDTLNLSPEDICRVRFLTANQDFRGSRDFSKLAEIFLSDESIFDERNIFERPESFVKDIGITDLSQSDKRVNYARNISKLLLEAGTSPFGLLQYCNNDLLEVKKTIISYPSAGYGNKKADMMIRDMVLLGVWNGGKNFDKIDVASDINTVNVALRTGILKSAIPLVSSFLDIFCYQYSYVDDMNAQAWRRVWEIWNSRYPTETIASPCQIDYFIYKVVGKQFCKESLYIYQCETGDHIFKWHSNKNRRCQVCYKKGILDVKANRIGQVMPCTDPDGYIAIEKTEFVRKSKIFSDMKECPFKSICDSSGNRNLLHPKSISIKGRTGWETAYTKKGNGGGGLMS